MLKNMNMLINNENIFRLFGGGNMTIKISIIVPIFNTESFLKKCIDSIISQTYNKFELILVNDGSTDRSGVICDDYAKKDQRIHVIHKTNGGASSARNAGIEYARGDYISFVDSDDYIHRNTYEILYTNAKKYDADIVCCNYLNIDEGKYNIYSEFKGAYTIQLFNNIEALNKMYLTKETYINSVVPWNKLYNRMLFNNIKYEIGNIYDDETVAHKLLYNSNLVISINAKLYYYVKRNGSQMNSPFHVKKFDKISVLRDRLIYFRRHKEDKIYQKALKHYMDMFFWYYYLAKENLRGIDKELIDLKSTFDKTLFYLLFAKRISCKQKLMLVCFSISPLLFEILRDSRLRKYI